MPTVTWTFKTTQPTGTYYWTNSGTTTGSDFSDGLNSGSFTVSGTHPNRQGVITRTLSTDEYIESSETIIIQVRKDSTSGTILITADPVTIAESSAAGAAPPPPPPTPNPPPPTFTYSISVTPSSWTWNVTAPVLATVPATLPGFSPPFRLSTNGGFYVYIKRDGTFGLLCGGINTLDLDSGNQGFPANVAVDWVSPKSSTVGDSYWVKFTGTYTTSTGYINGYNWITGSYGSTADPVIAGGPGGSGVPTAFNSGWLQLNSDRGMNISPYGGSVGSTGGKLEGLTLKIATSASDSAIVSNTLLGDFWYASVDNSGS